MAHRAAASSYTLYLLHIPAVVLLKAVFCLPRAAPTPGSLLAALVVLVAVLIYAQVVYQLFERNTARLREWLRPRVMGAAASSRAG